MKCSNDKVPQIRKEWAASMLEVKPYFDCDSSTTIEFMDAIQNLRSDEDIDVLEEAENTDFELIKKKRHFTL